MDTAVLIAAGSTVVAAMSAVFSFRSSGRANDTTDKATELSWVKEIRQDAVDTRRDMEACHDQVRTLSRQLDVVTREADYWIREFQFVHRTVWRDGATIERLREMLGPPPAG